MLVSDVCCPDGEVCALGYVLVVCAAYEQYVCLISCVWCVVRRCVERERGCSMGRRDGWGGVYSNHKIENLG